MVLNLNMSVTQNVFHGCVRGIAEKYTQNVENIGQYESPVEKIIHMQSQMLCVAVNNELD